MTVLAGAVPRWAVGLPVLGAVVLPAAATPVLDEWSGPVLRGVALLLAVAAAAAVDEPEARLLDASPTPFWSRVLQRLLVVAGVVGPVAVAVAVWTSGAGGAVPARWVLELVVLVAAAVGLAAALRRWTAVAEPAVLAGPVLVGGPVVLRPLAPVLPDVPVTTTARWWLGGLAAAALWLVALRDPATASHAPGARRR